jgi:hypothetical protein
MGLNDDSLNDSLRRAGHISFQDLLKAASAMHGRANGWNTEGVEKDMAKRRCMECFNLHAYCTCRQHHEPKVIEAIEVHEVHEHRDVPELPPAPTP